MLAFMQTYLTGFNGVSEALKRGRGILLVARQNSRTAQLKKLAQEKKVAVRTVSGEDLDRLVPGGAHRGFALEVREANRNNAPLLLEDICSRAGDNSLLLVLDGITDPQNLGTVLRSSDQFGADAVVIPRRRSVGKDADSLSRSSSGAVEWVPIVEVANIARALEELKAGGYWIWGADMAGEALTKVNLKGKTVVVMGREGEGLHRLVREKCDGLVSIPTGGRLDSLNVATAAGILLYEVRRQQGFPGIKL